MAQWAALTPLTEFAPALAGRRVLLLGAEKDEFFPPEHLRLLADAAPGIEWTTIPGADHICSAHRRVAVDTVMGWLANVFGAA
jgi:pimeloyl-ACP methyl ester carboxylesterase